jgi:hypothetical protein
MSAARRKELSHSSYFCYWQADIDSLIPRFMQRGAVAKTGRRQSVRAHDLIENVDALLRANLAKDGVAHEPRQLGRHQALRL